MTAGSLPEMATFVCPNCDIEERAPRAEVLPCWSCGQLIAPGQRSMVTNCATWRAEDCP